MPEQSAYTKIFIEFLQDNFGKTIGLRLLQMAEKKEKISFSELSTTEQFEFIKRTLHNMYAKFQPKENIRITILEIFLRYIRKKIENHIEVSTTKTTHMKDIHLHFSLLHNVDEIPNTEGKKLYLEIKEGISAGIIITVPEDHARTLMRAYCSAHDEKYTLDMPYQEESLQEFITVILPAIKSEVKKTYGTNIDVDISTKESVFEQYAQELEDEVIEIIQTAIDITLDNDSLHMDVIVLAKTQDEEMVQKHKEQKIRELQLTFEQTPPRVFIPFTNDIDENITKLLTLLVDDPDKTKKDIEEEMPIPLKDIQEKKDIRLLTGHIINQCHEEMSDNKKKSIRMHIEAIYNPKE